MKLHWSPKSPFVRKVMITAFEAGLSERIEKVRSPVIMTAMNAAVMRDNPLNKLPTLILDDGTRLYDSLVICLYLDSLHDGPKVVPQHDPNRLRVLRDHALGSGLVDLLVLWRNERERPGDTPSQLYLDAYAGKVAATLDHLEIEPPADCADTVDLAQITFGCALGYMDFRFPDLKWRHGRPRLAAWATTFDARPSAKATAPGD